MDDQVFNNLPVFRAQQGLSQQELADARKTISTIETTRRVVTFQAFERRSLPRTRK